MLKKNYAYYQLRLNLDNETQLRVYNTLERLNIKLWKSKNKYIIEALDFYEKNYGTEDCRKRTKDADRENERNQFMQEIAAIVRKEIMSMVGEVLKTAVVSNGSWNQTSDSETENKRSVTVQPPCDELQDTTLKLLDSWDNWEDSYDNKNS